MFDCLDDHFGHLVVDVVLSLDLMAWKSCLKLRSLQKLQFASGSHDGPADPHPSHCGEVEGTRQHCSIVAEQMLLIAQCLLDLLDDSRHCYRSFASRSRVVPGIAEIVPGFVRVVGFVAESYSVEI